MELVNRLFGVVVVVSISVLVCGVVGQNHWSPSLQKHAPTRPPPQVQQKGTIPHIPFDKCLVEEYDMIRCGAPDIKAEECKSINCCFKGHQCYYGKAVTVQCTRDGQFVVVVARDATMPSIDVESVSLLETNDPSCNPSGVTPAFAIFQFPMTACGTTVKEEEGYVVYENHMSSSYEVGLGPKGSITRDSHFELLFQCKYSDTAVEVLVLEVNDVPAPVPVAAAGPLRVELRLANGQCYSKGCVEEEAAYGSFYSLEEYPISKPLRQPVYVEVRILERSDPNIILNLEHCWATATRYPDSLPQWDLLVNGCPYNDDRYMTTVVPVQASFGLDYPSHYKRFIFKMFAFVDEANYALQKEVVFIHCAAAVCYPSSTDSCEQPCHRLKREVAPVRSDYSNQMVVVSSGGVTLTENTRPALYRKSNR